MAEVPKFTNDVDDFRIPEIWHVLFERQPQYENSRFLRDLFIDTAGDERPHRIIDAPTGKNDLRFVTDRDCAISEIEWVHADAMTTDEARREAQEIPLGACGVEHIMCGNAELLEDHRDFVDERDIDVALCVFDDLSCFGGLNVLRDKYVAVRRGAVYLPKHVDHRWRLTGDHLGNPLN